MASVSGANSLGNTSLRGFGGMVSGLNRDELIEQMTAGTESKITTQKGEITKLQWKQEAYRGISDKIIDLCDTYSSYTSTSNLRDASAFLKNLISVHGKDSSTAFVTATGSSDLIGNISLTAVKQLATSTVRQSAKHEGALTTGLDDLSDKYYWSKLNEDGDAASLTFVQLSGSDKNPYSSRHTFTFASSYTTTDADGKTTTHNINYAPTDAAGYEQLEKDLNELLKQSKIEFGEGNKISDALEFTADATNGIQLKVKDSSKLGEYKVLESSSAVNAFGKSGDTGKHGTIELSQLGAAKVEESTKLGAMTGQKVTFNYNGSQKSIELITKEEAAELEQMAKDGKAPEEQIQKMAENLQKRLDKAFGEGRVKAELSADNKLQFSTDDPSSTISITSGSDTVLNNMGISRGESNKVNLSGKLSQSALGITDDMVENGLTINGVTIGGINKNSSISDILSAINTSKAGVKATYVDATGQFMLVAKETGEGRQINLDSDLAQALFGGSEADGAKIVSGQDALIEVSYGNGVTVDMKRASNSFNLEGLNVTVTGTFGGEYKTGVDGKEEWVSDSSAAVTFSAKADVDGITEKVKKFFEDFNAMVTEVNSQITTRPDSSYGPLTDAQKDEMDETSIENWEKKAKQGILYGDSTMRDLSSDIQGIMVKLMQNAGGYENLQKVGVSYSEDPKDGGVLVFDEAKFRSAMESDPDLVSDIFTGGSDSSKGLVKTIEDTLTPYATRYASRNKGINGEGSYGRLIEEAGSEKVPTTVNNNYIYKQIKEMQERIEDLQSRLKTEQDRYIRQFASMETLISRMNSQSSYLSQLTG